VLFNFMKRSLQEGVIGINDLMELETMLAMFADEALVLATEDIPLEATKNNISKILERWKKTPTTTRSSPTLHKDLLLLQL
jgi:hypothetical protein